MTSSYQAQGKGTINVFNWGFQIPEDFVEAICARTLAPCPGKEGLERGIPKELTGLWTVCIYPRGQVLPEARLVAGVRAKGSLSLPGSQVAWCHRTECV